MGARILVVCLNPTIQKTLCFDDFETGVVNRATNCIVSASGKGMNSARVLSQLGIDCALLSHQGGPQKEYHEQLCRQSKVTLLFAHADAPIRNCITALSHHTVTEIIEEGSPVDAGVEKRIRSLYELNIDNYDGVMITGSRCPGLSDDLYKDFCRIARDKNKTVLLDLRDDDLRRTIQIPGVIAKPNVSEFASTFMGMKKIREGKVSEDFEKIVRDKVRELGNQYHVSFMLTQGMGPSLCFDGKEIRSIQPPVVEKVINTTGCGDSVGAGLITALLQGKNFFEACEYGQKLGGMNAATLIPGSIL